MHSDHSIFENFEITSLFKNNLLDPLNTQLKSFVSYSHTHLENLQVVIN